MRGSRPTTFGARLSFFFNAHNDFFQEVAKFRAARRLWARIMRERFGATNPKALALRFHAQTGGSTLTAQQPENNIVRVAIQALSAVCGGAQSLHTNSFDEALALPTERAATIALRTQQILQNEAGTTDTADPLGGSYYIEALTDELEARAWELIERVDELGGAVAAVEQGFVQGEIESAAFAWQQEVESGERVIVGVNEYVAEAEAADRAADDRSRGRAAAARAHRARARRAQRRRGRRRARARARRGARHRRTCSSRCATRCARAARSARSAACSASSGASTTSADANVSAADQVEVTSNLSIRMAVANPSRTPALARDDDGPESARPQGQWALAWRRLRRDRVAVGCGVFLVVLVFAVGPGAPLYGKLVGHGPNDLFPYAVSVGLRPAGPFTVTWDTSEVAGDDPFAFTHPPPPKGTPKTLLLLGADSQLGRDEFLRILYGGRVSLEVAVGAAILALLIGVVLGAHRGLLRRAASTASSRASPTS